MIRPHAGNAKRRSLTAWKNGRSFFFLRGHWSCPWSVEYFTMALVPELGYEGPTQYEYFRMPSKPELRADGEVSLKAAQPGLMLGEFPLVVSTLIDLKYDGTDERRLPGSLLVRPSAGVWLLILKDPSSALQLRAQAPTFEDALTSLELLLESEACPWETDPYAPVPRTQKKKK